MKKITILTTENDASHAVGALCQLGLLHIKHLQPPHADQISSILHKLDISSQALDLVIDNDRQNKDIEKEEIIALAKEIISLGERKKGYLREQGELTKDISWFDTWVNISREELQDFEEKGIFLNFYLCNKGDLKKISQDKCVYVVQRKGAQVCFVLVSLERNEKLGFLELDLPVKSRQRTERRAMQIKDHLKDIDEKIEELSIYKKSFLEYKAQLEKKLEFARVRFGMGHKEGICCLQGFCPEESSDRIKILADEKGWAIGVEEPDDPAEVPTLIRTPKWIKIINPVFKFMGTVPGYNEFDISFWFLLFFSLFFAMLIGDAGYGLVFLGLTLFARRRARKAPREPFVLMYVLSTATIVWGAVTGTWFGFEKIAQLPFLNNLVVNKIYSFNPGNETFIQLICFTIGAIHLTVAHMIKALTNIKSLKSIAQIGWISVVWGLFFLAGDLVLRRPMPSFVSWLFLIGAGLIIFFANPQKNILKGALLSLASLPLSVINSFSDVVSYIRLFAVGYASVVVAVSFNEMALSGGIKSFLAGLLAALILFVGHALNIALGLMAIIVHGIRLNLLEFSGHLDMQWSGKEYLPFKE